MKSMSDCPDYSERYVKPGTGSDKLLTESIVETFSLDLTESLSNSFVLRDKDKEIWIIYLTLQNRLWTRLPTLESSTLI